MIIAITVLGLIGNILRATAFFANSYAMMLIGQLMIGFRGGVDGSFVEKTNDVHTFITIHVVMHICFFF